MAGLPGAGKTTLLTAARAGGSVTVISRDLIRAAMFPGPAAHSAEQTRLAFEAMMAAAGERLRAGDRVALDGCCFARRWQRERAVELARETGARLVAVHLDLPVAEAGWRVSGAQAGWGVSPAEAGWRVSGAEAGWRVSAAQAGRGVSPAEAGWRVRAPEAHPANDRDAALVVRVARYMAPPEPGDLVIDARRPAGEVWALVARRLSAEDPGGGPGQAGGTGSPGATIVA